MPSPPHDAIIIVLDIGKSVGVLNNWESKTFFEQSKECVSLIIQRKLISQSLDVLSIVLIGCNEFHNSWTLSGYKNICCKFDFQHASWDMLKFIEVEVKTTEHHSDWVGAVVVSMEMLKVYEEFNNVQNKKIVFFSDFAHLASDNLEIIVQNIKKSNINITIIGPDNILSLVENQVEGEPVIKKKRIENEKSQERQNGEKIVFKLWQYLPDNIIICSFESALKQLCSYSRRPCRKTPWNCILDIGDVKISISMFKKTDPKSANKFNTKYFKPPVSEKDSSQSQVSHQLPSAETIPVIRDKVMHYKHETRASGEIVDVEVSADETIEGFRYGVSVIPFSAEDKAVMEYKPGLKSFSVIGFSYISSIPFYLLSGECSYVVLPRENDENAEVALSALVQALKQTDCLAVVRKVYSNNRGLSLGILYPFVEEIVVDETDETVYKECLLFIELAYKDEVKFIDFPALENFSKSISKEQYDAVDHLIQEMDLMEAEKGLRGEPSEAFELSSLHDFKEQFFHYCVIQKGLYPEKPLPKSIPSYIKNYVRFPKSLEDKIKSPLNEIKKNFKVTPVEKVEYKQKQRWTSFASTSAIPADNAEDDNKPSNDLDNPQHFSMSVINEESNLAKRSAMSLFAGSLPSDIELRNFFDSFSENEKINSPNLAKEFQNVYLSVREQYLNKNPDYFNWWLLKFKSFAYKKPGVVGEIWNSITAKNLGLISEKENKYSRVSEEEADDYFNSEVTQSLPCYTPEDKLEDFKPLPSEMDDFEKELMEVQFDF